MFAEFAKDYKAICRWFFRNGYACSPQEIFDAYEVLKQIWQNQRGIFTCKGNYKTVRRIFIKTTCYYFSDWPAKWNDIPEELWLEMVHKTNQGWVSVKHEPYLRFFLREKAQTVGLYCKF